MTTTPELPQHSLRVDIRRPVSSSSFNDLERIVSATYDTYTKIEKYLSPYNAKQSGSTLPFQPPSRDVIKEIVKRPMNGLHELTFSQMLYGAVRFCEKYKGKKQLPLPHPSTHHSAQFSDSLFELKQLNKNDWPTLKGAKKDNQRSIWSLELVGATSLIYIENLRPEKFQYLILRPKLAKLGTASAENWEALFFKKNVGYQMEHVDSSQNPRWAGILG